MTQLTPALPTAGINTEAASGQLTAGATPPLRLLRRGQWVTLHQVPASRTLLDVLRDDLGLTGTKEGCRSGDCGACTVVLGEAVDAADADGHGGASHTGGTGLRLRAINSCIRLAHSANGLALWTVEDLTADPLLRPAQPPLSEASPAHPPAPAASRDATALHPVQAALVRHHASQCGFCTPGFVMSLFALYHQPPGTASGGAATALTSAVALTSPAAPLSREDVLHALSGNLCRCTGYRPIVDAAMDMFSTPAVALDTDQLLFLLKQINDTNQAINPFFNPNSGTPDGTELAPSYLAPCTLTELLALRATQPHAQLVAGCTDVGLWVTKQHRLPTQVLDLTRVAELRRIGTWAPSVDTSPDSTLSNSPPSGLSIGAAVTLTDAFAALVASRPTLAAFTSRFAGLPVRNSGTLGGNVANGSPIGDSMPLLIALGAQVRLMAWTGTNTPPSARELPLQALYTGYRQNVMTPQEVLTHILIPPPGPAAAPRPPDADGVARLQGEWLGAYKVAKRFEDDISAVCLGLRVVLDQGVVQAAHIGVGGVAATPVQARQTEAALLGQPWSQATVRHAMAVLQAEFTPISDMRASAAYRTQLLGALLQRAWLASTGTPALDLAHADLATLAPIRFGRAGTPDGAHA